MHPLSRESVFNKASSQNAIPTCELHWRELRDGGNRRTREEGGGARGGERGLRHPSCYYLYGIAKHASGNQHEIVNCSAHLCVALGTGAFRRSRIERLRGVQLAACSSGLTHMTHSTFPTNMLSPRTPGDLQKIAVGITRGMFHIVHLGITCSCNKTCSC